MPLACIGLILLARLCLLAMATKPAGLNLGLRRQSSTNPTGQRHQKRSTTSTTLTQFSGSYFVNVSLGTPPQDMALVLDTLNGDTIVNLATSVFCASTANDCSQYGTYNPSKSSTYTLLNNEFSIQFADATGFSGDYITETMKISGMNLTGIELAAAIESDSSINTLGLGLTTEESMVLVNGSQPYPNVPQSLSNSGAINSPAYSLWLNDINANAGALLFGAVDTDKYTGELRTVSFVAPKASTAQLIIPLTEIQIGDAIVLNNSNTTASVDPGTTLTYLPENATDVLFNLVGAQYDTDIGAAIIDCAQAENTTEIMFTMSWPIVNVTMKELVIPGTIENGTEVCFFGITSSVADNSYILGQTFLRSAYVVYDLANYELSIAQTIFNATTSNVVEITNGVNGVPGAIRAPTSSATSTASSSLAATSTSTTGTGQPDKGSHNLSGSAKAGISVGVIIGVTAVTLAIFLLWRRYRNKAAAQPTTTNVEEYAGKPELSAEEKKLVELSGAGRAELAGRSSNHAAVSELPGSMPQPVELD